MATYSINTGSSTESSKVADLQTFLNNIPDNTAQLISPRDTRDALFTTWENIFIKETSVTGSAETYIGLDNDYIKKKTYIGKKSFTNQEILDDTLLNSDTDLFIYNAKIDSNPSLQDTKVSFLAGTIPTDYHDAPYIEASKVTSPSRIDLEISNPAPTGVIKIDSDNITLGSQGWEIDNTGALFPLIDGQDLGATPSNRIGNIYMSSKIDFADDLKWTVSNVTQMTLNTSGELSVDDIHASNIYTDSLKIGSSASSGYVLTSDGFGNTLWNPPEITSIGIPLGNIIVSDGSGGINWSENTSTPSGITGSVQFTEGGVLSSDNSNFFWDNTNKKLEIGDNNSGDKFVVRGDSDMGNINSIDISSENVIVSNNIETNSLKITSNPGVGKVLTSDTIGDATWETPTPPRGATGPNGAIQLSDGNGDFINHSGLNLDTDYGDILLKVGNTTDIGQESGDGIQLSGDLKVEKNHFIGFNIYENGNDFKRIDNGYSSYIKQENSGELNINLSINDAQNSVINPFKYIQILNDSGYVGINTTPIRQLDVNGTLRLAPQEESPSSPDLGDVYSDEVHKDLMTHDGTGWFKTSNKLLIQRQANDAVPYGGVRRTFYGKWTNGTYGEVFNERWYTRRYDEGSYRSTVFNATIPDDYIDGRDIRVELVYALRGSAGSQGGDYAMFMDINWVVGIDNISTNLSNDDNQTTYNSNTQSQTPNVFSVGDTLLFYREFIFNGTDYNRGDTLAIIILRDFNAEDNNNDSDATTYLMGFNITII